MEDRTPRVEDVFHALADPTRRAILSALAHGPLSLSRLAAPFEMTLTAVSQHVQILEQAGLVSTEKTGRVRTCQLEPAGIASLEAWIADHRQAWERKLDRLGELLHPENVVD